VGKKIFLSYTSDDRVAATTLGNALTNEGHHIENLLPVSAGAPHDVHQLATEFRNSNNLDVRARHLLDAAMPPPRVAFPVVGAVFAGLALTHLFWITGLYDVINEEWGRARGPISVNVILAIVGAVLCAAAWRTRVKGARLGFTLCALGVLVTVLDAIKIQWIPIDIGLF
jgi:hypothetical protein